jgi:hypothetical protein
MASTQSALKNPVLEEIESGRLPVFGSNPFTYFNSHTVYSKGNARVYMNGSVFSGEVLGVNLESKVLMLSSDLKHDAVGIYAERATNFLDIDRVDKLDINYY